MECDKGKENGCIPTGQFMKASSKTISKKVMVSKHINLVSILKELL